MAGESPPLGAGPLPGKRIGPYGIVSLIGSGGVASVYRATDAAGATVALKVLHPSRVVDEDVKRFTREYRALARMDHPNIVRVFEAGVDRGYPWLAMEFIDGADLGATLDAWKSSPPPDRFQRVERIFRALCGALGYIHDLGLVHRDFKPSNVLLTRDGVPKISDFGVVKDPNAQGTSLTVAGRLVGTVAFMAPEQITGDQVDARADLYALGAVLYLMLTDHRPIEASSVAGYLARHLTENPKPPSEYDPNVPARLERVCQRLLLKDPHQRYKDARATLEALDRSDRGGLEPLRGREAESHEWRRRMESLRDGAGGIVAVIGPTGAGRTHLLRHFADLARAAGHAIAWGAGDQDPIGSLLIGTDITVPGPKDDLAQCMIRGLRGNPRVLFVDDVDLARGSERAVLGRTLRQLVAHEGEPLLLVVAAESLDGPAAPLLDGTEATLEAEVVTLGELDRKATQAILRDRGLQGPALTVLSKRLHDDHQGRPGPLLDQIEALVKDGWLERIGDLLRPQQPLDALRERPLPVPLAVRRELEAALDRLDPDSRGLIEVLALLDRAATPTFVCACAGMDFDPHALQEALRAGLVHQTTTEEGDAVRLTHPATAALIAARMPEDRRRNTHLTIAGQLSRRRRREASIEVARHLRDGGQILTAYPAFVQAARAAARTNRSNDVLGVVAEATAIQPEAERGMDSLESARHRRWLFLLQGEAHLARGEWAEALAPLERAVAAARIDTDPSALARALASHGRALYRAGDFDQARGVLQEALRDFDPGAPERASATRALADILLRGGDVEGAESLYTQALTLAEQMSSRDAEARARRGLASVRVMQNHLDDAARQLEIAEELQAAHGDDRVRAGILAHAIELDTVCGRLGSAERRGEALLDLIQQRDLTERYPEAWALVAEARLAAGNASGAFDAARHAVLFAKTSPDGEASIRAARVLCALGHARDALQALPATEALPPNGIDDPPGQIAAAKARILAADGGTGARDLAVWVSVRPAPLMAIRAARTLLDASIALSRLHDVDGARTCAKRGLKALQGASADLLSLELLAALNLAQPDDRVAAAAGQLQQRIAAQLPPSMATTFRARADLKGGN